jgi:hypothetical protein
MQVTSWPQATTAGGAATGRHPGERASHDRFEAANSSSIESSVTLGPASVVSEHEVNVNGSSSNRRVPLAVSQRRPDRLQHRLGSEPALPCYHHYPAVSYVYVDAIS